MKSKGRLFLIGMSLMYLSGCAGWNNQNFLNIRPSDEVITSSVTRSLTNNRITANVPIQVETHNGVVSLSGYVKTIRQNDVANDIAAKVEGVRSVENNLVVKK